MSVWLSYGESEFLTSDLLSYSVKTVHWSWESWHMPLILELGGYADRCVWVWGQPGLHIEFQASCGYMVSLKVNKQTACINLFFVKVKYCHFIKFLKEDLESVSLIHQYCSYFVLWQKYNIPGFLEAFKHRLVSGFRAQSLSTMLRVFYDTISLIFYRENLKLENFVHFKFSM